MLIFGYGVKTIPAGCHFAAPAGKKEGRKEVKKKDTRNIGKLAIRPDHPRRLIKIKLSVVGGLRCVIVHVK